jgi:hypothetical protein
MKKINKLYCNRERAGELLESWRAGELESWRAGELESWRAGETFSASRQHVNWLCFAFCRVRKFCKITQLRGKICKRNTALKFTAPSNVIIFIIVIQIK